MIKMSYFIMFNMFFFLTILFFINMKTFHPISLIIMLITYSMMICLLMSIQSFNYMFSIMFFLMMISGLLIIFLYFASLISNEQNKLMLNMFSSLNMIINLMILSIFLTNYFLYNYYYSFEMNNLFLINTPLFKNIYNIFNYPFNNLTLICMIYLLIVLFSIIKICSIKSSSLRKLN